MSKQSDSKYNLAELLEANLDTVHVMVHETDRRLGGKGSQAVAQNLIWHAFRSAANGAAFRHAAIILAPGALVTYMAILSAAAAAPWIGGVLLAVAVLDFVVNRFVLHSQLAPFTREIRENAWGNKAIFESAQRRINGYLSKPAP